MAKAGSTEQKRASIKEHRIATCEIRLVLPRVRECERLGLRRAALTHERLIRMYADDLSLARNLIPTLTEGSSECGS